MVSAGGPQDGAFGDGFRSRLATVTCIACRVRSVGVTCTVMSLAGQCEFRCVHPQSRRAWLP